LGCWYVGSVPVVEQATSPQLLLSGEIDIASADEVRTAGARAVGSLGPSDRLDIDLSAVTFIDSSGLGALVSIRNAADAAGREMSLHLVTPSIIKLLELTGLRGSFTILPEPG
jgi:anti-sigma B factor antagonist